MSGPAEKTLAAALRPLVDRMRTDDTVSKRLIDGEMRAYRTGQSLTAERLAEHLNGGPVRGCYVMSPGTTTMVGVLDLDSHRGETPWSAMAAAAWDLMESLRLLGATPIAFRSGGGRGVHLYVLWDEPQDAYAVRQWFLAALRSCGYVEGAGGIAAGQVEIFPKRDHVEVGKYGAQVFLPLGGQSVPLAWEDLLGELAPMPREWVLEWREWPISPGVPPAEKPARAERTAGTGLEGLEMGEALQTLRAPLQAIADAIAGGKREPMRHDPWRALVQALHRVSGGGEDGRALAHWFSAQIPAYDTQRLDQVWDTSDAAREDGVGAGTVLRIAREYGWIEPLDESWAEDVSGGDNRPPVPRVSGGGGVGAPPAVPLPSVRRRGIPAAHYLTTDQANANRIKDAYGSLVLVAAGRWYVWDGKRWAADEGDVYRYACRLSDIVRTESKEWAAKAARADADGDGAKAKELGAIAKALGGWALKCEMKGAIEAAVGLLRKMLTIEEGALDRDPWLLNVENGVVDLRTGVLHRHDPALYITKLVPLEYRADARADEWARALAQITREEEETSADGGVGGEIASFLQRWAGYCLTGSMREQALVVHWGPGSNGKSVILEMLAETMGDYAGTAAPGLLLASRGERHPTEIADLMGRRMVTAHESGEGMVLREDFIKQATGGDRLTARFMRGDFFEFEPTHKLQLVTNHKPQVKGQDLGIWRRMLLLEYGALFGTAAQVEAGTHTHVRDDDLLARLRGELEGVLAWRVRGAVEWFARGLAPPARVLAATAGYRSQQDRVGQFVEECCEVGRDFEEALAEGMGGGLYPAYVDWCKEGGVMPLSKVRFKDDVLRVVPRAVVTPRKSAATKRKQVLMVHGVRLMPE